MSRKIVSPGIAAELEKIESEIRRWNEGEFSTESDAWLISALWEDFVSSPGLSLAEAIAAEKLRRKRAREAKPGKD